MAIKAKGQITLSSVTDVKATYRYYLLQSSTLTKPNKPTIYPPASTWGDTEPTYTNGSTNSLYFVDCTVFSDDTFAYSEVSLSSTYEAAKAAYNKALSAEGTANQTKEDLNNLEIGGRNLFEKSAALNGAAIGKYSAPGITISAANDSEIPTGQYISIEFGELTEGTSYNGGVYLMASFGNYIGKLIEGETYTVSVWQKSSTEKTIGKISPEFLDNRVVVKCPTLSTEWQRYIVYGTYNGNVSASVAITFYYASEIASGDIFYLSSPKVEKGNKATDWTPAPEDIEQMIDDVKVGGRNYVLYSSGKEQKGLFNDFDSIGSDGYCVHTFVSKKTYDYLDLSNAFVLDCRDYEVGANVIFSYDIMFTEWNFPEGSNRHEWWFGQRYTSQSISGGSTSGAWTSVTSHSLPVVGQNGCQLNEWYHVEKHFTIPSRAADGIGTESRIQLYNSNENVEASVTFKMRNIKVEYGNKATDWTPAPEDVDNNIQDTEKRILEATTEADTELVKDTEQILLKAFENYTLKNNGLRIVSVDNYYNATTTDVDVNMSTDGYITGVPALSSSKPYLLAYEVATYDDGSTVTSDPHLIATYSSSAISTITEHYAASPAVSEEELTEVVWSSTVPEVTSTNICLWHYETITFTNGTTVDSEKRIIGRYQKSFNELVELVESQLQVLKDSINMNFTTTSERTEYVNEELKTFMTKFYTYIKFSGDTAITIGSGDSAITLEIDNDTGIIFKKNGVEFGSWDGVDFHTGNIVVDVEKRAQFGNFAFVPRSDGSLMFLKVGG